jgi:predicted metal-binding membrane protein
VRESGADLIPGKRSRRGWATHGVRSAYLRLSSAIGLVPLRIPVSLILLTGVAWALMLHHAVSMSEPMGSAGRGALGVEMIGTECTLGGLGVFLAGWTVMMGAMMLPSAAPMILTFAAVQARRNRNIAVPIWIFVAVYILVWAYSGLVVYVFLHAGRDLLYRFDWYQNGAWAPLALGITLTLAGLYQFTPLKRLCLHRCRTPLAFLQRHWRDDSENVFEVGLWHGLYCLGCCWALYGVMLAAAGMSIAWMLTMTLVVFAEKALPHGPRISVAVALGLIALGLLAGTGVVKLNARS